MFFCFFKCHYQKLLLHSQVPKIFAQSWIKVSGDFPTLDIVSIFEHHFKSNKTSLFIPRHNNNMWQVVIPILLPEWFTGVVICNNFTVMWLIKSLNHWELHQSGTSFRDQGLQLLSQVYCNLFPLILWVDDGRMIRLVTPVNFTGELIIMDYPSIFFLHYNL